jgi:ABC-2 type transport system permease protein
MNKIWLIAKREYFTRVKTKTFVLSTILVPLGFALLIILPILAGKISEREYLKIYVIDNSHMVSERLVSGENFTFVPVHEDYETLRKTLLNKHRQGVLIIPEDLNSDHVNLLYYSSDTLSLGQELQLRVKLKEILKEIRIENTGISREILNKLNVNLSLSTGKLTAEGEEKKTSTIISAILGYIMAFLIYMSVFIYSSIVIRGVMEEKTNRIVELIISSVKPFELMLGKIIGIGSMGLTQLAIWFLLKSIILFTGLFIFSSNTIMPAAEQLQIKEILSEYQSFDLTLIFYFFFYFLGGYLLYGSLYAAIGSAVDQESDAQQLVLPVTMPLVLCMLIIGRIIQNPNGSIARFCSIFPFFSPMTMLVRLASVEVPWYELALSMFLLVATFLGSVWISAKIYRTGILMYGKKITFREMVKWIFI